MGVDLGTGGARALIADDNGRVLAAAQRDLPRDAVHTEGERHEQNADAWWHAAAGAISEALQTWRDTGGTPEALRGIAVDGTSGTLLPVDEEGQPVGAAIMYNDGRAGAEAEELNQRFADFCHKLGYRFAASFALSKALWLVRHDEARFKRAARLIHQADFINTRLTSGPVATDYSNALKTGYDLTTDQWPDWMESDERLGAVRRRLPEVVAPGAQIGSVYKSASHATGLPENVPVLAGCTDGTAGVLASGAAEVGETNTTLGTTLVFKRIAEQRCVDPDGLLYSHKLPGGRWLPGAASSTGGEWLRQMFADHDLAAMDRAAQSLLPSDSVMYPLARSGERFPFKASEAQGFCEPDADSAEARYAAGLQGTAMLERLCYEVLDNAAGAPGGDVYTTGGGSGSDVWTQLRADVTGRTMHRPASPEAAFGMAVLAASHRAGDLWQAVRRMVRLERTFHPDTAHKPRYDDLYSRFVDALRQRGYVRPVEAS